VYLDREGEAVYCSSVKRSDGYFNSSAQPLGGLFMPGGTPHSRTAFGTPGLMSSSTRLSLSYHRLDCVAFSRLGVTQAEAVKLGCNNIAANSAWIALYRFGYDAADSVEWRKTEQERSVVLNIIAADTQSKLIRAFIAGTIATTPRRTPIWVSDDTASRIVDRIAEGNERQFENAFSAPSRISASSNCSLLNPLVGHKTVYPNTRIVSSGCDFLGNFAQAIKRQASIQEDAAMDFTNFADHLPLVAVKFDSQAVSRHVSNGVIGAKPNRDRSGEQVSGSDKEIEKQHDPKYMRINGRFRCPGKLKNELSLSSFAGGAIAR
jgi:hypothetical protein